MTYFSEKVALVTGGASGIGLAIVQKLLERGIKGIAVLDISDKNWKKVGPKLYAEYPKKILFITVDITKKQELEDAFDKTVRTLKNLDIVFNNAGIAEEVEWERAVAVNLTAVITATYLARDKYFPKYKSGEEGVIVNTASTAGLLKVDYLPVYTATKSGVVGLVRSLGAQKSTNNTRIIAFCPGLVRTPLVESLNVNIQTMIDMGLVKKEMTPDFMAESVMGLFPKASNGSIWIIQDGETPFEVSFPETGSMLKQLKK